MLAAWTFVVAGAAFLDVVFAVVILWADVFEDGGNAGAIVDVGLGVLFTAMGVRAVFQAGLQNRRATRPRREDRHREARERLRRRGFVQVINLDSIAVFGGALKDIGEANITTGKRCSPRVGLAIMLSVYDVPAPRETPAASAVAAGFGELLPAKQRS